MHQRGRSGRLATWSFPARTTAFFLIVASLALSLLAVIGLREIRTINEDHSDLRVDRAARSAAALFRQQHPDYVLECDGDGSPLKVQIDSASRLEPGDSFDSLVDTIASVNQVRRTSSGATRTPVRSIGSRPASPTTTVTASARPRSSRA